MVFISFFDHDSEMYCEKYNYYEELFLDSFLNKIDKKFEYLEYVLINSNLLNYLINAYLNIIKKKSLKLSILYLKDHIIIIKPIYGKLIKT